MMKLLDKFFNKQSDNLDFKIEKLIDYKFGGTLFLFYDPDTNVHNFGKLKRDTSGVRLELFYNYGVKFINEYDDTVYIKDFGHGSYPRESKIYVFKMKPTLISKSINIFTDISRIVARSSTWDSLIETFNKEFLKKTKIPRLTDKAIFYKLLRFLNLNDVIDRLDRAEQPIKENIKMNNETISNCPFCKSHNVTKIKKFTTYMGLGPVKVFYIKCKNPECEATGPKSYSVDNSLELWNRISE